MSDVLEEEFDEEEFYRFLEQEAFVAEFRRKLKIEPDTPDCGA